MRTPDRICLKFKLGVTHTFLGSQPFVTSQNLRVICWSKEVFIKLIKNLLCLYNLFQHQAAQGEDSLPREPNYFLTLISNYASRYT